MAAAEIRPDWTIGTLTLTSGSKNFTTIGSALQTAAIQAGDEIITSSGNVLIIATITGQNSGTLMENCPASAAGAGQPLRIRFQPDGSRYNGATAELVQLLSGGNVYALGILPNTPNQMVVLDVAGQVNIIARSSMLGGTDFNSDLTLKKSTPSVFFSSPNSTYSYKVYANISDVFNGGVIVRNEKTGNNIVGFGGGSDANSVVGYGHIRTNVGSSIYSGNSEYKNDGNIVGSIWGGATGLHGYLGSNYISSSGGISTGSIDFRGTTARVRLGSAGWSKAYEIFANVSETADYGLKFNRLNGSELMTLGNGGGTNVSINGTLSKGGGTFLIDHPLDPANKNLRHGFVEAPRYDLIYRGKVKLVDGVATVNIDASSDMTDGTFAALTKNACVTSLQNQDGFARIRPSAISGGVFEIICEDITCTDEVAWVVVAERNDAFVRNIDHNCERGTGRFIPEFDKED